MSTDDYLIELAKEASQYLQAQQSHLEHEAADLRAQLATAETALHRARMANKRALNYVPTLRLDYICPRCWVEREHATSLTNVPGDSKVDRFRCYECGSVFDIPLDAL